MKKKSLVFLFALALVAGFAATTLAETQSSNSEADVTFTASTEAVDPVDPINPDLPGTETGTGNTGEVTLDFVPDLSFGTNDITGVTETYNSTNKTPYIQVTDKSGEYNGYTVSTKLSTFTHTTDVTKTFDAAISFSNQVVKKPSTNLSTAAPTATPFTIASQDALGTDVMSAESGSGRGIWLTTWLATDPTNDADNENVTLSVDTTKVFKGKYTATMVWSLEFTPSAP